MSICAECFSQGRYLCPNTVGHQWKRTILLNSQQEEYDTTIMTTSVFFLHIFQYLRQFPSETVIYIAPLECKDNIKLYLLQEFDEEKETYLKRIQVKYVANSAQLNQFITAISSLYSFGIIAIDHLDYFFNSQPNPLPQCTKTIALLTETILHEERENRDQVHGLVSFGAITPENYKEFSTFIHQWFLAYLHVSWEDVNHYQIKSIIQNMPHIHPNSVSSFSLDRGMLIQQ